VIPEAQHTRCGTQRVHIEQIASKRGPRGHVVQRHVPKLQQWEPVPIPALSQLSWPVGWLLRVLQSAGTRPELEVECVAGHFGLVHPE
jgi:hypothetical protein